jgi:hypothetical protein
MNMYAADAPLCPSGQRHHPKFDHFRSLHAIIQDIAPVLLHSNLPSADGERLLTLSNDGNWILGDDQRKFQFESTKGGGRTSVVFVENASNVSKVVLVPLKNIAKSKSFEMRAYSVLVLVNDEEVLFDSSDVSRRAKSFHRTFVPLPGKLRHWVSWFEPVSALRNDSISRTSPAPIEQTLLNVGAELFSDYAWFYTDFSLTETVESAMLSVETQEANAFVVFVDGLFVGEAYTYLHAERNVTVNVDLRNLEQGEHQLAFLSESLGFSNLVGRWGASTKAKVKGITGDVVLFTSDRNVSLLEGHHWRSFPGLYGEHSVVGAGVTRSSLNANPFLRRRSASLLAPTWSSALFRTPRYDPSRMSLFVETTSGRGHLWLNGNDLGRYWNITRGSTEYYSQRYYFLPFDMLRADSQWNELIMFDATGSGHSDKRIVLSSVDPSPVEIMDDEIDVILACL